MPDYVTQTDQTDTNADSTGCGMAFISWLMSQGHSLNQTAPQMVVLGDSGTFDQLYANRPAMPPQKRGLNFRHQSRHCRTESPLMIRLVPLNPRSSRRSKPRMSPVRDRFSPLS
jgi:hypothetical protein